MCDLISFSEQARQLNDANTHILDCGSITNKIPNTCFSKLIRDTVYYESVVRDKLEKEHAVRTRLGCMIDHI